VLPAVAIMAVACVYPVLEALKLSFYEWGMGTPWTTAKWVGLEVYADVLRKPAVLRSLQVTLVFALIVVAAEMVMGTTLALARPLRGMPVFRTIFILPMMIAPIVVGLTWRYLFDVQYGLINHLFVALGLGAKQWLADPDLAFIAIVVSDVWQWTPFVFIMVMAGLQSMDGAVMEAARVDGANAWQTILFVKLPLLLPILMVTLLMRLIDAFRVLEVIYVLTFGGPGDSTEIFSLHIYKAAFISQKLGYAAALSMLLLAVVIVLSALLLRISNPAKGGRRAG
jgi:multiple sugar transport system permease protein